MRIEDRRSTIDNQIDPEAKEGLVVHKDQLVEWLHPPNSLLISYQGNKKLSTANDKSGVNQRETLLRSRLAGLNREREPSIVCCVYIKFILSSTATLAVHNTTQHSTTHLKWKSTKTSYRYNFAQSVLRKTTNQLVSSFVGFLASSQTFQGYHVEVFRMYQSCSSLLLHYC